MYAGSNCNAKDSNHQLYDSLNLNRHKNNYNYNETFMSKNLSVKERQRV